MNRTKIINTTRVMRQIWTNKTISRVNIARSLNLNKSTVSNIITSLLEEGVVIEDSIGESTVMGGRKPINLKLNSNFGLVIGIEMRPESYTAIGVDLTGEILFMKTETLQISATNFSKNFIEILKRIESECNNVDRPLLGIGVGISAPVDPYSQKIRYSIPLTMSDSFDFYEEISKNFPIPVMPENDANCCAWGEMTFHRQKELKNFVFALLEFRDIKDESRICERTAFGIGIVINGRVFHGMNFTAGEFRSVFTTSDYKGQFAITDEEMLKLEEDPKILEKFIRELSKNLAVLANTFNLSEIFLGGDIIRYQQLTSEILKEELDINWAYPDEPTCKIQFSTMNDKSVAYGAAGMLLDRIFMDEELAGENRTDRFSNIDLISTWLDAGGRFNKVDYGQIVSQIRRIYE